MGNYEHPGRLFVQRFGTPQTVDDVRRFASFLREEAGLDQVSPIDLADIRARFGIPTPKLKPLPNQQGLLLNPERGTIIINSDDPVTRQRFTEGHELMELLFAGVERGSGWAAREVGGFQQQTKERLCNAGAAELLMPSATIRTRVSRDGMSTTTARAIAAEFQVSFTAALVQLAAIAPGCHAVVLWEIRHKPTELRRQQSPDQLTLFGDVADALPAKKLRIVWSFRGPTAPFVAPHMSAPDNSAIVEAWHTGVFVERVELLGLGGVRGMVRSENTAFVSENERQVLSLLHLPGDEDCTHR